MQSAWSKPTISSSSTTSEPRPRPTRLADAMTLLPLGRRLAITMRSTAVAICSSMSSVGRSMPKRAMSTSLRTASSALPACNVVRLPSCPVFMAWSMSMHSSPRTSPTTMRSGLMRRAFFTRSLMVTSPVPSMDASLASSRTTLRWLSNLSSAESSIVTIRSRGPISHERALSSVVLPEPVPPATAMPHLVLTAQDSRVAYQAGSAPSPTRRRSVHARSENLRMVMEGPSMEIGSTTAFTRSPFGRRALTRGLALSSLRPRGARMRSMAIMICSGESKRVSAWHISPPRS